MTNVIIYGAKNSAIPIIAGTLLCAAEYTLTNIPLNSDVMCQLSILKQFNVDIKINNNDLFINTKNVIIPNTLKYETNTRGTYYFLGSTIHYSSNIQFELGNGCNIDNSSRKINYHLELIEKSGKRYKYINNNLQIYGKTHDQDLSYKFQKPSVGATINALFIYSKLNSISTFENYAKDPYVIDVIEFLRKIGIDIYYDYYKIVINGKSRICNSDRITHQIICDPIEAISYIIFASIYLKEDSISPYTIGPINITQLGNTYNILKDIGIELIRAKDNTYYIKKNILKPFNITTGYFPELYTDCQPFFCILSLFIDGISTIREQIWDNRFNYIKELQLLGYNIDISKDTITINNNHNINNECLDIKLRDLRAGMAVYMLTLKNNINCNLMNKCVIHRGYTNYDTNLDIIRNSLIDIKTDYSTKELSNMNIGGTCKYYTEIANLERLKTILKWCKNINIHYKIIGGGYNIYFGDYYNGIIIKNKQTCIKHNIINDDLIEIDVESGVLLMDFVEYCAGINLDISKLAGIPSTIGGAIYGNAGAYGLEISDIIHSCVVLSKHTIITLTAEQLELGYRYSRFKSKDNDDIILSAKFRINKSSSANREIWSSINNILTIRRSKFRYDNTLGSIFKNVIIDDKKYYIWELLDKLELRGKIINNIRLSEINPNIFENVNNATPNDMKTLINYIILLVKDTYNIHMEPEIEYISIN
jgi:UDP-N-acetylglucosamine 1-carboxyvinyltransferase